MKFEREFVIGRNSNRDSRSNKNCNAACPILSFAWAQKTTLCRKKGKNVSKRTNRALKSREDHCSLCVVFAAALGAPKKGRKGQGRKKKMEAHINRSMVTCKMAAPVTGTTLRTIGPVPGNFRQRTPSVRNRVTR